MDWQSSKDLHIRSGAWAKRFVQRLQLRFSSVPKRSLEDYATHLPVLVGLARVVPIRRVLEFGCGQYSTIALLNRYAFPDLENLRSFEIDETWSSKVLSLAGQDPRLDLRKNTRIGIPYVEDVSAEDADLAFIDDGTTPAQRAQTIRECFAMDVRARIVVVHDFEVPLYRQMIPRSVRRFSFDGLLPCTGVIWRDNVLKRADLRSLNRLIGSHAGLISMTDHCGWVELFRRNGFPVRKK